MRWSCLWVTLLSFVASAQSEPWQLNSESSELVVKVWKTGAAAGLAHDHVVRASKFSGNVGLDEAGTPESLKLEVTVEAAALVADEPDTRKRHNVPGAVPEGDRKKMLESMLGDEQLQASKFPTIRFAKGSVSRAGDGKLLCSGELTLHGVTKTMQFPVTVKATERRVEGAGTVRFKTSDFGIKPFSTALGLVRNQDEVELVIRLVLKR